MPVGVKVKIKQFILLEECPAEWKAFDLYLVRDGEMVFYAGRSYLAYDRVWEHLLGGWKARSLVGRFVWCNWPASMNFEVELLSSGSPVFAPVHHDPAAAEEMLIRRHKPCLNDSLNGDPSELPARYYPPNAEIRCPRSLTKLKFQAAMAVKNEEKRKWMEEEWRGREGRVETSLEKGNVE